MGWKRIVSARNKLNQRPGRISNLTPELADCIVEAVRKGMSLSSAAALNRLAKSTLNKWMVIGQEEPLTQYGDLLERICQARAECEMEHLEKIRRAPDRDAKAWTASAWYLERTDPKRFGRKDQVNVRGQVSHRHSKEDDRLRNLTNEELDALYKLQLQQEAILSRKRNELMSLDERFDSGDYVEAEAKYIEAAKLDLSSLDELTKKPEV